MTEIPEKTCSLFVYGTLVEQKTRRGLLDRDVPAIDASVSGYVKSTLDIEGKTYPVAIPGSGCLEGMILDVTPEELETLDEYETDAYRRICVLTTDGERVFMYTKKD